MFYIVWRYVLRICVYWEMWTELLSNEIFIFVLSVIYIYIISLSLSLSFIGIHFSFGAFVKKYVLVSNNFS